MKKKLVDRLYLRLQKIQERIYDIDKIAEKMAGNMSKELDNKSVKSYRKLELLSKETDLLREEQREINHYIEIILE